MNTNTEHETTLNRFAKECVASCQKLIAQLKKAKDGIEAEYRDTVAAHGQLLHLALNEAEAIAFETDYPHLVFPTLALEKAQAVANWNTHQHAIRRVRPTLSLAA
jgi:hypothetical protein